VSPLLPHNHKAARKPLIIQPPKRPQLQQPRYFELEQTQPPPPESVAQSPVAAFTPPANNQPSQAASDTAHNAHEVDTEGPTGPLGAENILSPREQKEIDMLTTVKRRTFWQKLFKPTSR